MGTSGRSGWTLRDGGSVKYDGNAGTRNNKLGSAAYMLKVTRTATAAKYGLMILVVFLTPVSSDVASADQWR